ncbi:MAG: riboflavin synthase [bacterium]
MFTGIVETMGTVRSRQDGREKTRFEVLSAQVTSDLEIGDSVAVEGCCLTVVGIEGEGFAVEAIPETLRLTSLGELGEGDRVNLEQALRLEDRLGGHLVSGHVDGVGVRLEGSPEGFEAAQREEEEVIHWYTSPPAVRPYLVPKGSITVQGVSLTVVEVAPEAFSVALIPHTLEVTTLGTLESGDRVNLEADMIAKYVAEQLRPWLDRLEEGTRAGTASERT